MIYNRNNNKYFNGKESKIVIFLYKNKIGNLILNFINNGILNKILELYMSSSISKISIKRFIKKNNIDMTEYKNNYYESRKIDLKKRPMSNDNNFLIAPCDSKLSVYVINEDLKVKIKNRYYSIENLINNKRKAKDYNNGYCLIFRLGVEDYHHYYYIDDGELITHEKINGKYDSVRPIALENKNILSENNREWSLLKTKNFDNIIYMEVGALSVGKIVNYNQKEFKKGEEKGYFKFGGSTIVLLIKNKVVEIDNDIIRECQNNNEVQVKLFEKIGVKVKK